MGVNRGVDLSQGVAILLLLLLAGMHRSLAQLAQLRIFENLVFKENLSPTAQFIALNEDTVPQKGRGSLPRLTRQRHHPII